MSICTPLVLDGVFARAGDGRLRFHRAAAPTTADIADVLAAIVPAVRRRLAVGGSGDDAMEGADRFADAAPVLAGLAVASVRGVLAVGGVPGRRPERLGEAGREEAGGRRTASGPETPHARWEGFDLHAGVAVPGHPARLERLCRYVLRPPVTGDRLSWTPTGGSCCRCAIRGRTARRICGSSRRRSWSGSPCWCRGRASTCCSITVCAPRAAWRAEVVARAAAAAESGDGSAESDARVAARPAGRRWADLMRRAFDMDVLACPRCGGRLRLLALIEAGAVTVRILRHLGFPTEVPAARPARAPPLRGDDGAW